MAESSKKTDKKTKKDILMVSGRRKTAIARVFLQEGKGDILVNNVDIATYFPSEKEKQVISQPFHLLGISHPASKYNATILVSGSGKSSQLGAVVLGISKALASMSEENHSVLRRNGFLTRDPRMVERKKPFLKKARKRPQYSKR